MQNLFTIMDKDIRTRARTGLLSLPHGTLETPVFMPVGTNGTVKAVTKDDLESIGFSIILANTYHLFLRPGPELIKKAGGLHGFTGWNRNFLTDSGGFQVFSLSKLCKITEDGVKFQSHIDGSTHFFSPEKIVDVQTAFSSDIFMQLDVCTPWGADVKEVKKALRLTTEWAIRSKKHWLDTRGDFKGYLFPIIQGNFMKDLRKQSAEEILELGLPGIAIGGLSVGEPFDVFSEYLDYTSGILPESVAKYVMGIGTPEYILEAVQNGIDMFDCVFPTRTARNGLLFTKNGPLSIKQLKFTEDLNPPDSSCSCTVCKNYSRAYLKHLFKCNEILFSILASTHNLFFLHSFMAEIRQSIREHRFSEYKENFLKQYSKKI